MSDVPLIVAGSLAILGAAVHGVGGEVLVKKLSEETLSPSPLGGPRTTIAMIHVTWHTTTVAYITAGVALILSGAVLDGDEARGVALVAAGAATGFAAIALGLGALHTRTPRGMFRHPGPLALTAVAALAWWGVL
jgi:hypothetical protein